VSPAKASRTTKASRVEASRRPEAEGGGQRHTNGLAAVSPEQLTLLPRPEPPPEALAAIAAAAQLLWTRPAAPEEPHPAHDAWRFSGRWWAQPALVRRARPWARP
jgi:hypothetical protein